MSSSIRSRIRRVLPVALVGLVAGLPGGAALHAQQNEPARVAVIDVGRILEESQAGQELFGELKQLQESKYAEAEGHQSEIKGLQEQIAAGRLSLSQERLDELRKSLEAKVIALKRFEDDSNRELNQLRQQKLERIEQRVMPLIDQVGREFGYTLIFNKFQSGLVYARDEIDITDLILERFDAADAQGN